MGPGARRRRVLRLEGGLRALSVAGRVLGVALVCAGALILLLAAGAAIQAAYVYVDERCWHETQNHCDSDAGEKLFAIAQMLWGLGAAGFALVCCAQLVRWLAASERTERLGRHTLIAFALMGSWLLGPYLLLVLANA